MFELMKRFEIVNRGRNDCIRKGKPCSSAVKHFSVQVKGDQRQRNEVIMLRRCFMADRE